MFPFYEILFSVIGFLFVIMLAIIGYFLQKQITAIEKLELSTNSLDKTVSLLQSNQENFAKQCGFHHRTIDHSIQELNVRINDHSEQLIEHGKAIVVLESATRNSKPATRNNSNHG